jgi:biopolymer transport protein ExbB/TolQ
MEIVKGIMDGSAFHSMHSVLVLVVLGLCSLVCLMFIVERWLYFRRITINADKILLKIRNNLVARKVDDALGLLGETEGNPLLVLIQAGIKCSRLPKDQFSEMMRLCITKQRSALDRNLGLLGTLGNVAPFIGLLGTVLGIIQAFQDLAGAQAQANGANVVATGIAEALIATATGLMVAIPAVVFYNYFLKKVKSFLLEMEVIGMEMSAILYVKDADAAKEEHHANR